jgi:DNA-binding MarR family transcriptional regulator
MRRNVPPNELAPIAESPFGCACFNVRRASRAITQLYDEAFQQLGLKATQFSVLIAIGVNGEAGIGALAEALVTDRTTMTRNVRHLIDRGYVVERESEDRRARPLKLTAKGRKILRDAAPIWLEVQARVEEALGANGMRSLKKLSDQVVQMVHPELDVDLKRMYAEQKSSR